MALDKYDIAKNIRLSQDVLDALEDEANYTGVGHPGTLIRMILLQRLRQGDFEALIEVGRKSPIATPRGCPKANVYLSESLQEMSSQAAEVVSGGQFTGLIHAVLAEWVQKRRKAKR